MDKVVSAPIRYRSGHDPYPDGEFEGTVNNEPSLAIQSEKDNCDINVIMKRFGVTGVVPQIPAPPDQTDFAEAFDFQSAMNLMRDAQTSFMAMSGDVRARFGNDPVKFVEFCSDKANLDEMVKLGLAVKKGEVIEKVMKVEVVNPATK